MLEKDQAKWKPQKAFTKKLGCWSVWAYVWRRAASSPSNHLTRSRWTGPGVLILQAGHTVWVAMRARLGKCNSDQLRPATHFESVGADLAQAEELQEIVTQTNHSRTGAVDVAGEGSPPPEAWDGPSAHAGQEPAAVIQEEAALPPIPEVEEGPEPTIPLSGQPVMRNLNQPVPEAEVPIVVPSRRSSARTVEEPPGNRNLYHRFPPPGLEAESINTKFRDFQKINLAPGAIVCPVEPRVRRQVSEIERSGN